MKGIESYRQAGIVAYDRANGDMTALPQVAETLANEYNIMRDTIILHARSHAKEVRLEQNKRIVAMKAAGYTTREIANKVGGFTIHRMQTSKPQQTLKKPLTPVDTKGKIVLKFNLI